MQTAKNKSEKWSNLDKPFNKGEFKIKIEMKKKINFIYYKHQKNIIEKPIKKY